MLKTKIFLLTFLFIQVSHLISNINCHSHELYETRVVMFVFGDSVFDPGNSNFLNRSEDTIADHWPYGITFFHFPTGRYCDGRISPDFLAMDLGLPLWKPYLGPNGTNIGSLKHGANFACAGAQVISSHQKTVIDLPEQVEFFKNVAKELKEKLGETEANKTIMEAIYLSSIGGIDYDEFYSEYTNSTESQRQQFIELVIGNLTNSIKEIYEIGGRKFAFQNVGPMGCLPMIKLVYGLYGTDKCVEGLLDMPKRHNAALLEAVKQLERTLDGFKYSVFDYYTILYDMIENPTKYGLKVSDVPCYYESASEISSVILCNNTGEYLFFDVAHPTERVNVMLTYLMWHGGPTVAVPRNFRQLAELDTTTSDWNYDGAVKSVGVEINDNVATI